jgi:hypothetical protein
MKDQRVTPEFLAWLDEQAKQGAEAHGANEVWNAAMAAAKEQEEIRLAAISTAAFGYWTEQDSIKPEYDHPALRDVAKLYAKYAALSAAPSNTFEIGKGDHIPDPDAMAEMINNQGLRIGELESALQQARNDNAELQMCLHLSVDETAIAAAPSAAPGDAQPVACRFVDHTGDYVYSTVVYPSAQPLYAAAPAAPQQSPDELEVTAADLEAIRRFKLEQEGEAPEAPQQG